MNFPARSVLLAVPVAALLLPLGTSSDAKAATVCITDECTWTVKVKEVKTRRKKRKKVVPRVRKPARPPEQCGWNDDNHLVCSSEEPTDKNVRSQPDNDEPTDKNVRQAKGPYQTCADKHGFGTQNYYDCVEQFTGNGANGDNGNDSDSDNGTGTGDGTGGGPGDPGGGEE